MALLSPDRTVLPEGSLPVTLKLLLLSTEATCSPPVEADWLRHPPNLPKACLPSGASPGALPGATCERPLARACTFPESRCYFP